MAKEEQILEALIANVKDETRSVKSHLRLYLLMYKMGERAAHDLGVVQQRGENVHNYLEKWRAGFGKEIGAPEIMAQFFFDTDQWTPDMLRAYMKLPATEVAEAYTRCNVADDLTSMEDFLELFDGSKSILKTLDIMEWHNNYNEKYLLGVAGELNLHSKLHKWVPKKARTIRSVLTDWKTARTDFDYYGDTVSASKISGEAIAQKYKERTEGHDEMSRYRKKHFWYFIVDHLVKEKGWNRAKFLKQAARLIDATLKKNMADMAQALQIKEAEIQLNINEQLILDVLRAKPPAKPPVRTVSGGAFVELSAVQLAQFFGQSEVRKGMQGLWVGQQAKYMQRNIKCVSFDIATKKYKCQYL
ncbi:MAG: hypothetical protein V2B19_03375 [Pseudomonadota bacterium]